MSDKDVSSVSSSPSSQSTIKTVAFFDLETTGLPDLEFFRTKITEISIVACSVEHLLATTWNETPRVLHKITLCLNPYKRIDLKASEVTGLTNELLEHENKFDKNTMNLIECYLFQLQQPVCLIAHNGNKFDFPLLRKQYEAAEGSFPHTLKCCDSLPVFQKIDEMIEQKLKLLKDPYSLQQWNGAKDDNSLLVNLDTQQLPDSTTSQKYDADGIDMIFDEMIKSELKQIEQMEQENKKPPDGILTRQAINESTPNKPTKVSNLHAVAQIIPVPKKRATAIKRELFPSTSTLQTRQSTKGKFTLREIYRRFYQAYPENSHDSESDVMSLLKCAVACKTDFMEIVNKTCVVFNNVKKF